jgi:hypothetical protein
MSAVVFFGFKIIKNKASFKFPWQFPSGDNGFGKILYRINWAILIKVALGGSLELLGASGLTVSFKHTFEAGLNGGMVGAIISVNSVFIVIASYILF